MSEEIKVHRTFFEGRAYVDAADLALVFFARANDAPNATETPGVIWAAERIAELARKELAA